MLLPSSRSIAEDELVREQEQMLTCFLQQLSVKNEGRARRPARSLLIHAIICWRLSTPRASSSMKLWFMKRKRKYSAQGMAVEELKAESLPVREFPGSNHVQTRSQAKEAALNGPARHDTKVESQDVGAAFQANLASIGADSADYDRRKEQILKRERELEWDRHARSCASETQIHAGNIIHRLREHERDNLFGNKASEAVPGPETLDMGGQFLTNKPRIEMSSDVFRIAREIPKGCHLHLHFNAELTPTQLIEEARKRPNMYIRSTQPLVTAKDFAETEIVFDVKPLTEPSIQIFTRDYSPEFRAAGSHPWMLWSDFQTEFQVHNQRYQLGVQNAEDWVQRKMVLSPDEAYNPAQTTNGVWARFNQATRAFKGLMNYESVYRWYIGAAIDNMILDGVMYAELRPMLLDKSIPSDDGETRLDHRWQMDIIIEEVRKKQKELESRGQLHKFPFGLKIIYCAPRSIPKPMMQREIKDCIELHLKYPTLVCGFDLVGAEDRLNHVGHYRDELLAMVKTCDELNIKIPFMFHAGETLLDLGGSKDPANSNLYDAVLLNAKRIGHGYSLLKHPVLVERFKDPENPICVELCPTSNELLHLCRNVKEHPYPEMLAAGLECTVNSDNPSLFSNSVSHEFYQIMVGSPTMTIHGWRQLVNWSVKHSRLSPEDKVQAYEILDREWEAFCQWIVDTYEPKVAQMS